MIKKLLTIIAILICNIITAQEYFYIGPNIGVGIPFTRINIQSDDFDNLKSFVSVASPMGFRLGYSFNEKLMFTTGFDATFKQIIVGFDNDFETDYFFHKRTSDWIISLSVPIGIVYRFPLSTSPNSNLIINGGISFDYYPYEGRSLWASSIIIEEDTSLAENILFMTDYTRMLNLSTHLGFGIERIYKNNSRLIYEIQYSQGIKKSFHGVSKVWKGQNTPCIGCNSFDAMDIMEITTITPDEYYTFSSKGSNVIFKVTYFFSIKRKKKQ